MFCTKCGHDLSQCTCPDLKERLAGLGSVGSFVATKWCIRCDNHYSQCKCAEPQWKMKVHGHFEELPGGENGIEGNPLENREYRKALNKVCENK